MENRSFYYFQTHTLPKWTEFFDSDLWSQQIMQLSHVEPAIKHGILALSTMHERFESTFPVFTSSSNDFAFVQYMQAVKHSNELLRAHSQGRVGVEKVLIACIIFTCYENLAGNYRAANMHLRNGLLILNQHKRGVLPDVQTESQESIGNVLYRFDLQAMTFSDNTSPYDYGFDNPPDVPEIPDCYTTNSSARNDIVALMRCMMWVSGIANINPNATDNPTWLRIYTQVTTLFDPWEHAFENYQRNLPPNEQGDPKIYAGNTLLKMSFMMARIIMAAGGLYERKWLGTCLRIRSRRLWICQKPYLFSRQTYHHNLLKPPRLRLATRHRNRHHRGTAPLLRIPQSLPFPHHQAPRIQVSSHQTPHPRHYPVQVPPSLHYRRHLSVNRPPSRPPLSFLLLFRSS